MDAMSNAMNSADFIWILFLNYVKKWPRIMAGLGVLLGICIYHRLGTATPFW